MTLKIKTPFFVDLKSPQDYSRASLVYTSCTWGHPARRVEDYRREELNVMFSGDEVMQ